MGLKRQFCRRVQIAFLAVAALLPLSARGQDIGVVAPRTLAISPFNNVACVAGLTSVIPDQGLNVHVILWDVTAGISAIQVELEASFSGDAGTYFSILFGPGTGIPHGGTYAAVYMPFIRVRIVSCTGAGNITLTYTGTWSLQLALPPALIPVPFGPFNCTSGTTPLSVGPGPGTFVAIPSTSATERIHVCTWSFALSAASGVQFIAGTGVTCGTGTVNMTASYPLILSLHLTINEREEFAAPPGNDICIVLTGAATLGGYVSFAEF